MLCSNNNNRSLGYYSCKAELDNDTYKYIYYKIHKIHNKNTHNNCYLDISKGEISFLLES